MKYINPLPMDDTQTVIEQVDAFTHIERPTPMHPRRIVVDERRLRVAQEILSEIAALFAEYATRREPPINIKARRDYWRCKQRESRARRRARGTSK